jgi:HK97 gp10 family phage protein
MSYALQIVGIEEFKDSLEYVSGSMPNYMYKAMNESVISVQSTAREEAPYRTGNLKRSIYTDIIDGGIRGVVGVDANMAPYGIYQEFGTSRGVKPKFYMRTGMEKNEDKIQKLFEAALENIVKDLAK